MASSTRVIEEVFSRFLNLEVSEETMSRLLPLLEKVNKSIREDLDLGTVQGKNALLFQLATLLAYGWGLGMHPFHNPLEDEDGNPNEVRTSKDILVPVKDLQSIRYVKKDRNGRIRKVLFEPDQNARVRHQIENILAEISMSKWDGENHWDSED
ncbi:MAG: hypothetical protein QF492_07920 [Candidatus Krumholzibacteria bacterium]|jgi:hypothetical protein|nr:hypothetical protein [Candidatus Krumholzibacteria bacterium]MDP6669814.1 hypothetical protein [Candidatus Krumholzibacteria bacterium]MDP6796477.1 hypothetical protein [Candidatus Krumholzibacteria bacterium]MDP7021607.1 hypothetical protein [Candidatus Krumholzibacteria bacterium]